MVDGVLQGPAVQTLPDSTRYEGAFVDGKHHDRWLVTQPDGKRFQQQYAHGSLVSTKVRQPLLPTPHGCRLLAVPARLLSGRRGRPLAAAF